MPNNWDDEDEDQSQLIKDLRKQIKNLTDKNSELNSEVSTLRPQVRKTSVSNVLTKLGVNPKIAALVPQDVEPTEQALKTWLEDFGDVFGVKQVEEKQTEQVDEKPLGADSTGQTNPIVDKDTLEAWQRLQSADSASGTTAPDIEQQQLSQLGAAAAAAGGNFDSFVSLLRGEKTLPY